ncbi:MAG TPA: type II toxin-antitoxin system RelE/ParE family toxin [Thermoanaerobaculia bacterium]|nr:type II toxin-antitoxin system RelE/ParE family toxin [Thermoanaerobaculia bacterium]
MASSDPRWHVEALLDAQSARDWYAARSPLAARGFLLELEAAVSSVLEAPLRYPRGKAHTRRHSFPGRYPYTLVYRFVDGEVEIVAVAHDKRHPDYWLHR